MKLSEQVAQTATQIAQIEFAKDRLQKRVQELVEENTQLKDRIDALKADLAAKHRMPRHKMPPVMGRLLNMLLDNDLVTRELAEIALTRGGTRKALDVHFSMLRRRLPVGVTIKNARGEGWFIPKNEKPLAQAIMQ